MKWIHRQRTLLFVFMAIYSCVCIPVYSQISSERSFYAVGTGGAVSSGSPQATEAAITILKAGGNAVDAAIAAGFMLGVSDFTNSGLGGDGFALIRTPEGQVHAWDGAIKRPFKEHRPDDCHIGLPALPHLLLQLHRIYGSLNIAPVIKPALEAAEYGVKVSSYIEKVVEKSIRRLTDPAAIAFLAPNGYTLRAGQVLLQPQLAATLKQISEDYGASFYRGAHAKSLIQDMRSKGSQYEPTDLALYRSRPVRPVKFKWQQYAIYGTPPPSSSLATIRFALELLLSDDELYPANAQQLLTIVARGRRLLETKYDGIAQAITSPDIFIERHKNEQTSALNMPQILEETDSNTTHLCVWDKNGMVVTMTLTLGSHFGSGHLSPLGFFYNNQMRNYTSLVSGYPEDYPRNAGPVSAKSPILVTAKNAPILALGGAGGNRIIFNTGLALARALKNSGELHKNFRAPRFFLDYRQQLHLEWGLDEQIVKSLQSTDLELNLRQPAEDYFGLMSGIEMHNNILHSAGDHRRTGDCAVISESH